MRQPGLWGVGVRALSFGTAFFGGLALVVFLLSLFTYLFFLNRLSRSALFPSLTRTEAFVSFDS